MGPPVPAMWVHLRVASMIPFFQSLYEPSRAALPGGSLHCRKPARETARHTQYSPASKVYIGDRWAAQPVFLSSVL